MLGWRCRGRGTISCPKERLGSLNWVESHTMEIGTPSWFSPALTGSKHHMQLMPQVLQPKAWRWPSCTPLQAPRPPPTAAGRQLSMMHPETVAAEALGLLMPFQPFSYAAILQPTQLCCREDGAGGPLSACRSFGGPATPLIMDILFLGSVEASEGPSTSPEGTDEMLGELQDTLRQLKDVLRTVLLVRSTMAARRARGVCPTAGAAAAPAGLPACRHRRRNCCCLAPHPPCSYRTRAATAWRRDSG